MSEMRTVEDLARLRAQATLVETPCADGVMVWHCWGNAGDEPVVLLHGGSGSWTHWARNIGALRELERYVIVPDLPGFGDSAAPPLNASGIGDADGSVEPFGQGLAHIIGLRRVDLVGFSYGSQIAGFLAEQQPERVRSVTIVGAPGLGLYEGKRIALRAWRHLTDGEAMRQAHAHNLRAFMLAHDESVDDLALHIQATNTVRDRMQRRRLAATDALLQSLKRIQCPLYAIYGEHDALYEARMDRLQAVLQSIPSLKRFTQIDQAGHWVQYEQSDAFHQALLSGLNAPP